jgi:hypothetical protein
MGMGFKFFQKGVEPLAGSLAVSLSRALSLSLTAVAYRVLGLKVLLFTLRSGLLSRKRRMKERKKKCGGKFDCYVPKKSCQWQGGAGHSA